MPVWHPSLISITDKSTAVLFQPSLLHFTTFTTHLFTVRFQPIQLHGPYANIHFSLSFLLRYPK